MKNIVTKVLLMGSLDNALKKRPAVVKDTYADLKESASKPIEFESIDDVSVEEVNKRYSSLRKTSFVLLGFIAYCLITIFHDGYVLLCTHSENILSGSRIIYSLAVLVLLVCIHLKLQFIGYVTRSTLNHVNAKIKFSNYWNHSKANKKQLLIMPKIK